MPAPCAFLSALDLMEVVNTHVVQVTHTASWRWHSRRLGKGQDPERWGIMYRYCFNPIDEDVDPQKKKSTLSMFRVIIICTIIFCVHFNQSRN